MKKLTQAQKDKIKKNLKNIQSKVQSGELQTVVTGATRYSQGKPVVIKKDLSKEKQKANPDTTLIFGVPVPTNYLYIGGAVVIIGIVAITKKRSRNK